MEDIRHPELIKASERYLASQKKTIMIHEDDSDEIIYRKLQSYSCICDQTFEKRSSLMTEGIVYKVIRSAYPFLDLGGMKPTIGKIIVSTTN